MPPNRRAPPFPRDYLFRHNPAIAQTPARGSPAYTPSMNPRFLTAAGLVVLLSACATVPRETTSPDVAAPTPVTVVEAYVSAEAPAEELDSLATWPTEDGKTWLIASGKSSHRLVVFDADNGEQLRTFGGEGKGPGEFKRPNGLAVHGDQVFVVERDNHRVQLLSLPDFKVVGTFGEKELRSPYGIWLTEKEPGELEVYITDSFMYGKQFDVVPPFNELDQRVRRYRVSFDQDGAMRAQYAGSFGDTREDSALRMVESIAGDPDNDRMLIADEDRRHLSTLREYSFSGRYTGRTLPQDAFGAEAEGVALWTCPDGSGYWIAVDQLAPLTIFHLFDRVTLQPRGSFEGATTARTDGVALHAAASEGFPGGALFAVHDDKSISAFDLRDVARSLGLKQGCTE
jgi:3-phytase